MEALQADHKRKCGSCHKMVLIAEFSAPYRKRKNSGLTIKACNECRKKKHTYYINNLHYHKHKIIEKLYGLTGDQYDALVAQADDKCQACGDIVWSKKNFHVDHDHTDGFIRGIICSNCNFAIGHLKNDPERMIRVALYVMRSQLKRGVAIVYDDVAC